MKRQIAILIVYAAVLEVAYAEPQRVTTPCPACKGARSLSLTPPNLGQHDGEIDVTKGKPFTSHRWDVKHERCPLCGGSGRHETWLLKVQPPKDRTDKEACTTCWWSGVEPCRRCSHTGYVECQKCRSSRNGSKPGWIVEEQKTQGRISYHGRNKKKIQVKACGECGGIGKVKCAVCDGLGGQPCKRCKGEGYSIKRAGK